MLKHPVIIVLLDCSVPLMSEVVDEDLVAFSNSESEIYGAVLRVEIAMESRDFNAFVSFR